MRNTLSATAIVLMLALAGCGSTGATEAASPPAAEASAAVESEEQSEEQQREGEEKAEAERVAAEEEAAKEAAAAAEAEAAEKAAEAKEKAEAEKAAEEAAAAEKNRIDNATELSARDLSLLAKNPDDHFGETMIVYGEITQFDAATGACIFRANIAYTNMADTWDYEHNSIFTGGDGDVDCPELDEFVTDDEVRITATSMGSFSYDTQIGGNTTVPMFLVEKMSLVE